MTEKVKKVVEKVIDKVVGLVDVELLNVATGNHSIFLKDGHIDFVNGVAKVDVEIAKQLKEYGYIK